MKNVKHIIIVFLLQMCVITLFAQYSDHRNRRMDSLELVLAANPPTGGELAVVYRDLMYDYQVINIEKSMDYARKCLEIAIPLDGWGAVANCYRVLGLNFYVISQYDSAMVYFDKALEATERMRDFPKKWNELNIDDNNSRIYGSIGNLYNMQGKYHEAVEYYQKALEIFTKNDWKESQAVAYLNIGDMFLCMDNYQQAEISYKKLETLAYQANDSLLIAHSKFGLCMIFIHQMDFDKALEYADKARDYYFTHPEEPQFKPSILNTIASIYMDGYNDDRSAEKYISQAIQIADSLDAPLSEKATSLRWLSAIHLKRGEWRNAEQTALEALVVDDSEPANTMALYNILAKSCAHLGNAAKAAEYIDKLQKLQSSWSTKHYQSAIREMEVKYETEKNKTRIAALEFERRLWYGLSVAGGVIVILSLVTVFFVWRWSKKRQQLVATQAILDGETSERSRIARDLHDGLGSLLSSIRYNMKDISAVAMFSAADMERYDKSLTLLDQSIYELRRVAHHLMPDALTRFGLKSAIGDFCKGVSVINFSWFGDESRFDTKTETVVYRIVHELVGNALKHSGAKRILVQIVQEPGRIALMVEDNGCGFDTKTAAKGMGLQNTRTRVDSFGGLMDIHSVVGEGTEINVEFQI